jgi:hypothetical protein
MTALAGQWYDPAMKLITSLALAAGLAASSAALADTPATKTPPAKTPAKDAPAKDAPKADASDPDIAKFLVFFDKLVDIAVTDQNDCKKMATDVNAHIDLNKALLDKAKEAQAKGQKLPDSARDHMMQSAQKLMGAMQKCGSDKDVNAAFGRLPRAGGPGRPPAK